MAQRRRSSVQMTKTPNPSNQDMVSELPRGHKRTASAPASSMNVRYGADSAQTQEQQRSRNSQGWMSWVGSFFYDVSCALNLFILFSLCFFVSEILCFFG